MSAAKTVVVALGVMPCSTASFTDTSPLQAPTMLVTAAYSGCETLNENTGVKSLLTSENSCEYEFGKLAGAGPWTGELTMVKPLLGCSLRFKQALTECEFVYKTVGSPFKGVKFTNVALPAQELEIEIKIGKWSFREQCPLEPAIETEGEYEGIVNMPGFQIK